MNIDGSVQKVVKYECFCRLKWCKGVYDTSTNKSKVRWPKDDILRQNWTHFLRPEIPRDEIESFVTNLNTRNTVPRVWVGHFHDRDIKKKGNKFWVETKQPTAVVGAQPRDWAGNEAPPNHLPWPSASKEEAKNSI
jgi:hypothetical protein